MSTAVMKSPADEGRSQLPLGRSEKPMDDGEIQTAMTQMTQQAIAFIDGELSPLRALAEKYYNGELFGNEEEGRSKIVMTVLRDTVLMIMPSLLRIFFGAEPAVEYGPSTAKQIKMAEQVTKFVLDVILTQDNSGFLVFHDWFKDALVKRIGIVKYWQDDGQETREYQVNYQTYDQLTVMSADDSIEMLEIAPCEASPPGTMLYDAEFRQTRKWSRTRVQCLPPEEYLYTKGARSGSNDPSLPGVATFVAHRTRRTRSQLRAMGVSEDDIEQYAFPDVALSGNVENITRQSNKVTDDDDAAVPEANRTAQYIEAYPYLDVNNDGISELCRVIMLGAAYTVIGTPEPCARRPFAVITPDPTPHMIEGQAVSDYTMDMQKIVSMIWRSISDSLTLTLNPRIGYIEGEASLEDILNMQLGAPIRMRSAAAIQPIDHEFVGAAGLQVLDALSGVIENRVGVTKASAGLDASALQSSSAAAVSAAVTNAQQHIEMIARVFAETGVKSLFKGILELVVENPDAERMVRVNGEYEPMDARSWDANLDVRVNVAIGAGTLQEKLQALTEIQTSMDALMQVLGPSNPVFSLRQYRDLLVKKAKLRGFADAESMFLETDPNWAPPPPDPTVGQPEMVIAQAEAAKGAAHIQKLQADQELEHRQHEVEAASKARELDLKAQDQQMSDQRERQKMEQDLVLAVAEMNLKYKTQLTVEQMKAEMASRTQHKTIEMTHNDAGQVIGMTLSHKGTTSAEAP